MKTGAAPGGKLSKEVEMKRFLAMAALMIGGRDDGQGPEPLSFTVDQNDLRVSGRLFA
jgi:hypothetical protein